MSLTEVPVSRLRLTQRIRGLHRAFRSGSRVEVAAEALYELLIAPVAEQLETSRRLVVVLDTALERVPFSALRNGETGRYMVQDRTVVVGTSLAAVQTHLDSSPGSELGRMTPILAIGDPVADPVLELGRLPRSEMEARAIADRFPRTTLLLGHAATEPAILEAVRGHEVLHYAGHVLVNDQRGLYSSLALAPTETNDGLLFAHEILEARLQGVRLAVVSGCGPGTEASGSLGLARALLAAGVPETITSLWDVADQPTADLFERFYAELQERSNPVEALRAAQLSLLDSHDTHRSSPASWGAFQLTVGAIGRGERNPR